MPWPATAPTSGPPSPTPVSTPPSGFLRRKEQHRFWGVDCYSHEEDRYLRIGNRLFYENPDQEVEPSAQIVVASDAWARELARQTLSGSYAHPVLHPRRAMHARRWSCVPPGTWCRTPPTIPPWGSPEAANLWLRDNPDMAAIDGRTAHRLFMADLPVPRHAGLLASRGGERLALPRCADTCGGSWRRVWWRCSTGRHYLSELGMKRAANMSRVLPGIIKSRHGPYLDRPYREHEQRHNDGVNRLVVQFAREGVEAVAGWRGEVNVPGPHPGAARPAGAGEMRGLSGRGPTSSSSSAAPCSGLRWRRSWDPTAGSRRHRDSRCPC